MIGPTKLFKMILFFYTSPQAWTNVAPLRHLYFGMSAVPVHHDGANLNVLYEFGGNLDQGVCGPLLEPVDRRTVHQARVHAGTVSEALANR